MEILGLLFHVWRQRIKAGIDSSLVAMPYSYIAYCVQLSVIYAYMTFTVLCQRSWPPASKNQTELGSISFVAVGEI